MDYFSINKTNKSANFWWLRLDLNQRPSAYESGALPLSYAANCSNYTSLPINAQIRPLNDGFVLVAGAGLEPA